MEWVCRQWRCHRWSASARGLSRLASPGTDAPPGPEPTVVGEAGSSGGDSWRPLSAPRADHRRRLTRARPRARLWPHVAATTGTIGVAIMLWLLGSAIVSGVRPPQLGRDVRRGHRPCRHPGNRPRPRRAAPGAGGAGGGGAVRLHQRQSADVVPGDGARRALRVAPGPRPGKTDQAREFRGGRRADRVTLSGDYDSTTMTPAVVRQHRPRRHGAPGSVPRWSRFGLRLARSAHAGSAADTAGSTPPSPTRSQGRIEAELGGVTASRSTCEDPACRRSGRRTALALRA